MCIFSAAQQFTALKISSGSFKVNDHGCYIVVVIIQRALSLLVCCLFWRSLSHVFDEECALPRWSSEATEHKRITNKRHQQFNDVLRQPMPLSSIGKHFAASLCIRTALRDH